MSQILILHFLELINGLLWFYQVLIIASVIVNLLSALNVLNTYNRGVFVLINALNRFTDPVLYQIRRVIPTLGGLDFSPVITLFIIHVLRLAIDKIQLTLS